MKLIHIVAGLLALISGFIALFATKGSPLHRAIPVLIVGLVVLYWLGRMLINPLIRKRPHAIARQNAMENR